MVQASLNHFGRIDILINNAGINIPEPALEVTEEHWDRLMDINLKGLFFCAQKVGQVMVGQGRGKVINIGSQMGLVGGKLRAAYCSSKGGVVQLTKVLAIEWAQHGVNVNGVAPGYVRTDMLTDIPSDVIATSEESAAIKRPTEPIDVANVVLFLCSEMARQITGQVIRIDAGLLA